MHWKTVVKALLPRSSLQWLRRIAGRQDMALRLANMNQAGFTCVGAVDGGAFRGEWCCLARQLFQCPILAIEPLPRPELEQLAASREVTLERVALGDTATSEAAYLSHGSNSRIPSAEDLALADPSERCAVRVARLDEVLEQHQEFRPNLLKLDLQGAELRALKGAGKSLAQFEVIVCEVSLIRIGEVPLFDEISQYLSNHQFRLYDILPAYYRPLDGALWQADAFYVRRDSSLVASTRWGP